jgi:hypothetical protein
MQIQAVRCGRFASWAARGIIVAVLGARTRLPSHLGPWGHGDKGYNNYAGVRAWLSIAGARFEDVQYLLDQGFSYVHFSSFRWRARDLHYTRRFFAGATR